MEKDTRRKQLEEIRDRKIEVRDVRTVDRD